jgi:hypothetical protein
MASSSPSALPTNAPVLSAPSFYLSAAYFFSDFFNSDSAFLIVG